jgi:hypothetical protein
MSNKTTEITEKEQKNNKIARIKQQGLLELGSLKRSSYI